MMRAMLSDDQASETDNSEAALVGNDAAAAEASALTLPLPMDSPIT